MDDLKSRIKEAEKELEEKQKVLYPPKAITLNELHGSVSGATRRSLNPGRDLNVVLSLGTSAQTNLVLEDKSLAYLTQERKKPSTSYGTRRANFRSTGP